MADVSLSRFPQFVTLAQTRWQYLWRDLGHDNPRCPIRREQFSAGKDERCARGRRTWDLEVHRLAQAHSIGSYVLPERRGQSSAPRRYACGSNFGNTGWWNPGGGVIVLWQWPIHYRWAAPTFSSSDAACQRSYTPRITCGPGRRVCVANLVTRVLFGVCPVEPSAKVGLGTRP
jgi:hypothetical protein